MARKVIVFAYDEGTEGSDRGGNDQAIGLGLPGYQNDLIAAVAAANRRAIFVGASSRDIRLRGEARDAR